MNHVVSALWFFVPLTYCWVYAYHRNLQIRIAKWLLLLLSWAGIISCRITQNVRKVKMNKKNNSKEFVFSFWCVLLMKYNPISELIALRTCTLKWSIFSTFLCRCSELSITENISDFPTNCRLSESVLSFLFAVFPGVLFLHLSYEHLPKKKLSCSR